MTKDWIGTSNELAQIFGVVPRTITLWGERGCPKLSMNKWDLTKVVLWWAENVYEIEKDPDSHISAHKTEYWEHHARIEKTKADVVAGSVMKKDEILTAWAWRVSETANALTALALRLAPLLEGLTELEIRRVLSDEIWVILDNFSREGHYTHKAEVG